MVRNKYTLLREETKMDLVSVFVFQLYVLIRFNVTATYFMNIIHDVEMMCLAGAVANVSDSDRCLFVCLM